MSRGTPQTKAAVAIKGALLCALLAASILPDHLLNLVCRSGVVMAVDACCPADEGASAGTAGQSAWRDEACCSLRAVDLDRAVPDRPGQAPAVVRAVVLLPAVAPVPPLLPRRMARLSPPPPRAPPIAPLLLKSSFLL